MACCSATSHASQASQQAPANNPNRAVAASASLDFVVRIGKFVYLRVGSTGAGISTIAFAGSAAPPPSAGAATDGANLPADWNGAAPALVFTPVGSAVLPVEVQSNAGPVTLSASVDRPLASGADVIAMSQITISSSNAGLPAPPVPAAGSGTPVNVAGTAFGNLVTVQSANWTFGFRNSVPVAAGQYSGRLSFTASVP